ncbi:MAG TPA: DUF2330 domain-containing protein [Phycisphaerales bacterium]|nr:DUF2330 domain-containing protein [Phycisphaerales bacterium]HMP37874.1 DUF2330 domain-containing protein [Phycisphaerales bacterium]
MRSTPGSVATTSSLPGFGWPLQDAAAAAKGRWSASRSRSVRAAVAALAIATAWTASPRSAPADGSHFSLRIAQFDVRSVDQAALLVAGPDRTTAVVRTGLRDAPDGAAWIMPLPARPADLRLVEDLFPLLNSLTAPIEFELRGRGAGRDGVPAMTAADGVVVGDRVVLGTLDIATLSGTSPDAILAWLENEGFRAPPGSRETFESYTKKNWWFIAAKLIGSGSSDASAPKPLAFSYDAPPVYPMVISRLSADDFTEIVLYVVAPYRTIITGPNGRPMRSQWSHIDRRTLSGSAPEVTTELAMPIVLWLDRAGADVLLSIPSGRSAWTNVHGAPPSKIWRVAASLQPLLASAGLALPGAAPSLGVGARATIPPDGSKVDPSPEPWITRLRLQLARDEMRWDLEILRAAEQDVIERMILFDRMPVR